MFLMAEKKTSVMETHLKLNGEEGNRKTVLVLTSSYSIPTTAKEVA